MNRRFEGQVAIVTGGASGIGLATARAFAGGGAAVVIADRNEAGAVEVAKTIEDGGGKALGIAVDVSDHFACAAMVERTVSRFGRLDIAFNNAGVPATNDAPFEDIDIASWNRVMATNINGIFYCMKAEVPALRESGGGAIINTASSASFTARPGLSSYITSKHGVAGLTKAAALDLVGYGIRVNAICPGMTSTAMMAPLLEDPDMRTMLEAQMPIGRLAAPEEIAQGVLFLASRDASYAVGTLLHLDGGLTLL
jgi:NAD(P)-dependent dehydrogenase (short-subunit alcohol dehydrogenase family)